MKTKYLLIVILMFTSMNAIQAQTDEEFLAEAFFSGLDGKGPKIYIEAFCGIPFIQTLRSEAQKCGKETVEI